MDKQQITNILSQSESLFHFTHGITIIHILSIVIQRPYLIFDSLAFSVKKNNRPDEDHNMIGLETLVAALDT